MRKISIVFMAAIVLKFIVGDVASVYGQEEEFTLEEITVTAQKRAENQQKVPIAMDVFSGQDLSEMARNDVDSILSQVSSAFISRTEEGLRITIRGVGFDTPAGYGDGAMNASASVAVNYDGVFTNKRSSGNALYDMERVEVLFGPQSTLYASNAPGGIVNIEMAKPKLDNYEFSGTLESGKYNLLHTEASLNAPVSEIVAVRAAFNSNVHDGYLSNGSEDADSKSSRLRVLYKPNEKLSVLITGEYEKATGHGMSTIPAFKDQDDVDDPWHTDITGTGKPRVTTNKKIYASIGYDFGFGVMTIIPSKSDDTSDRTSTEMDLVTQAILDFRYYGGGYEKGLEARMVSPSESRIKWNVGLNWYKTENERYQEGTSRSSDYRCLYYYHQFEKLTAVLGNITFPVADQFRLVIGGRYSKDNVASDRRVLEGIGVDMLSDQEYKKPDYKLGLEYDLSDSSMLYASWSTSYRVQGESTDWRGNAYEAEKNLAYIAGLKSRFLENKLQINSSIFYYDYSNRMFVAMEMAYINPPGISIPDEGGRAPGKLRMYGADIQTSAIITSKDKVDLSVSYLDSFVTDLFFDYQYLPDKDYSNRVPTFSPKWTINLNYNHNFNLPNGGIITAHFDTRYQSEYNIDWKDSTMGFNLKDYKTQEPHHMDNLGLLYAHPDGKWTLSCYIKNLWNYAEKRFMNIGPNMNIGQPRIYGSILTVSF